MTREELKPIMKYFQTAYPGFCKGANLTDVMNVWFDAFGNEDARIVRIAAKNYVKSSEYAPTIAGVEKQITLLKETRTATELWECLRKAISNSAYNSAEEFERLPQECRTFIGSAVSLKNLSQEDMAKVDTVVRGQFLKNVEQIKASRKAQSAIPHSEVQKLTNGMFEIPTA